MPARGPMRIPLLSRRPTRGQSLVEFALVLPIILFLVMVALDFGRVYLGYINLQNMARIAANFAADNPDAWTGGGDATVQTQFRDQILNDAKATNCALPAVAGVPNMPTPTFTDTGGNGSTTDIGDTVAVGMTCTFRIATPVISNIFGGTGDLSVSATAVFPVTSGLTTVSGGNTNAAPTAQFIGSPTSGAAPLVVQFTDQSTGSPTTWAWDIDGDGFANSSLQNPQFSFALGLHTVTLVVSNSNGSSTETKTNYIAVSSPPSGISFTALPTSGVSPLTVQFTDTSTGTTSNWEWDFNNDGVVDSTIQNPSHVYPVPGTYSVTFAAIINGGPTPESITVPNLVTVSTGTCVVPNFAGVLSSNAQALWSGRGFTTIVNFRQGNLPWTIVSQNQVVDQTIPCTSSVTVSKN